MTEGENMSHFYTHRISVLFWVPVLPANILWNNSVDKSLIQIYNAVLMSRISDILPIGDKCSVMKTDTDATNEQER